MHHVKSYCSNQESLILSHVHMRPLRFFRLSHPLRRRARRHRVIAMLLPILLMLAILTPLYIIYKPPHFLIRYLARRYPMVLWHVPSVNSTTIALTIDDAPSDHTAEILEVLAENEAAATFFVIGGQVAGREVVLQTIVAGGHELGNHGMHDEPATSLATTELARQIVDVESLIASAYSNAGVSPQKPPRYYRPGSGFFSRRMLDLAGDLRFKVVLGSVYPHDAQIPSAWLNARHILSMARPGAIIICHDRRSWTAPMLRNVLPALRRDGYRIVTVSQLVEEAQKSLS